MKSSTRGSDYVLADADGERRMENLSSLNSRSLGHSRIGSKFTEVLPLVSIICVPFVCSSPVTILYRLYILLYICLTFLSQPFQSSPMFLFLRHNIVSYFTFSISDYIDLFPSMFRYSYISSWIDFLFIHFFPPFELFKQIHRVFIIFILRILRIP